MSVSRIQLASAMVRGASLAGTCLMQTTIFIHTSRLHFSLYDYFIFHRHSERSEQSLFVDCSKGKRDSSRNLCGSHPVCAGTRFLSRPPSGGHRCDGPKCQPEGWRYNAGENKFVSQWEPQRLKSSAALVPPNPKEFDSACSTAAFRM